MKKSTILGMKITKNVILCSKLIANLPSYHVQYLILCTKKNFRLVEVLACSLVDFSLTESSPDWDYIQDYGY